MTQQAFFFSKPVANFSEYIRVLPLLLVIVWDLINLVIVWNLINLVIVWDLIKLIIVWDLINLIIV